MAGSLAALFILIQAIGAEPAVEPRRLGIEPAMNPTPQQRTESIMRADCRVENVDGRELSFVIEYVGERGYRDPADGVVKTTRASATFSGQEAALFAPYSISAWPHQIRGQTDAGGAAFHSGFKIDFLRTQFPYEATPPYRIGLTLSSIDTPSLLIGIGFCNRQFSPQNALSDEEIAALVNSDQRSEDKVQ
ncbi:MAG TPA: hypothetical protein PKD48_07045 [Sphingopyxis sp.]|nr:hypothetical protein [Sphingopyxis sp.]